MAEKGFVSGFEDGCFRPDELITYQEILCILNNVAAWASMNGYEYNQMELAGQAPITYGSFAPWAQMAARNLDLFHALIPGLSPSAPATREVAAASLYRNPVSQLHRHSSLYGFIHY